MLKMATLLILVLLLPLYATSKPVSDNELKTMISSMLVVGFDGEYLNENSELYRYLSQYRLGGVVLFDRDFHDRNRTKNIRSPQQLQRLTTQLQTASSYPLLIAIDQEGGNVARMKPAYGFRAIPSAAALAAGADDTNAKNMYANLAQELHANGINCNFAPVVDLARNPKNKVIVALERAYAKDSDTVVHYAKLLIRAQDQEGIISVLKHFPGHGSSLGDSHEGFVDVTQSWDPVELEPYRQLIHENKVDMIMTAHVYNATLDATYPATLSYRVNSDLLRHKMRYRGIIISDDLQMKAISKQYDLNTTLTLAVNAGVDMLLFGNQLAHNRIETLVETMVALVHAGAIPMARIQESYRRINALRRRMTASPKIIDRPIKFGIDRIAMTRQYIQQHYDLNVSDITITPKIIVLHWTAIMNLHDAFKRLEGETLFHDRSDIANAGQLNVSAHFIVDRDGTIYRLMPETWMARHVIGLNYSSIGIENIGGEHNTHEDLTPAQVRANIVLVRYLKNKYPGITYLIGHHEYRSMESSPLWLEQDSNYRTLKADPGNAFMTQVRHGVRDLGLQPAPEKAD